MKKQNQHWIASSIFLLVTICLLAGGIIGTFLGIIELHRVRQTANSESRLAARIEYITRRNKGSENRIQILLIDTNELIDISIAKMFTLEMESGDAVYVLKSVSGKNYYLCDYIRYHKATIWLRILIFIFCIGLSILFAFGTVSILRTKKGDK